MELQAPSRAGGVRCGEMERRVEAWVSQAKGRQQGGKTSMAELELEGAWSSVI